MNHVVGHMSLVKVDTEAFGRHDGVVPDVIGTIRVVGGDVDSTSGFIGGGAALAWTDKNIVVDFAAEAMPFDAGPVAALNVVVVYIAAAC